MASAVVRVKRHFDEEPSDNLILSCKKRKTEGNAQLDDDESQSTILKFAGTIETQEEDIFKHIKKPTKAEIEEQFKKHVVSINEKLREQTHTASKNSRYKVISFHRSNGSTTEESKENDVTIVDIESDGIEASSEKCTTANKPYVYDLYYTNSDDFGEFDVNELIRVYPLSNELVYGSHRDNGCILEDSDDSEDSNAENNWRNDYPDESDMESITEEDMLGAMNNIGLNENNELSSDDGEEGFVYSIDSEAAGFEEDIDPTDVRRYGEMYARFKARVKKLDEPDLKAHSFYFDDIEDE